VSEIERNGKTSLRRPELLTKEVKRPMKKKKAYRKLIEIYTEDIHKVLNCQNVAKHAEFYLG